MEEKEKLTEEDLELVNGGVGQDNDSETDETTDGPSLIPSGASFEKWVD